MAQGANLLSELRDVQEHRRDSLRLRVGVAAAITVAFSPLVSWEVCVAWAAIYLGLQFIEHRFVSRSSSPALIIGMIMASNVTFGAFALFGPYDNGPWGMAAGICMLCGAFLNAALSTMKSRTAFLFSSAPYFLMFAAMPVLGVMMGAHLKHAILLLLASGFCAVMINSLWRRSAQALADEAAARARAEAADAAKSAFVAMVSHELRTPISAMLAGAAEASTSDNAQDRAASLDLITNSARMMRTLLNDLLDLSKIEAGRMNVEEIAFDLQGLLAETVRFWEPEARQRGLGFRVQGADRLPEAASGDPTRIRQVLNNLFSNAMKFTSQGEIALLLDCTADGAGLRLSFTVSDTGVGMTPEQSRNLFTAFAQADASIARTHGGTGLGLAISRELARLMGGDLTVESAPGKGSAFHLSVLVRPAASVPAAQRAQTAAPEGLRILAADDHPINRQALQLILQPLEADLVLAEDGQKAVELARADRFDLVLLDLNMPVMGGLDAARIIRREHPGLPILALTGSVSDADRAACRTAGMDGFVAKPIEARDLYDAIDRALRSSAAQEKAA